MANSIAWDETTPAGSESKAQGDDRIREFKQAVRERAEVGGHEWNDSLTHDGKHCVGISDAAAADSFSIWDAAKTVELYRFKDTELVLHANVTGGIKDSNGDAVRFGGRRRAIIWTIPGNLEVGAQNIPWIETSFLDSAETATLVDYRAFVLTQPAGASIRVDLKKMDALGGAESSLLNTLAEISAASYLGTTNAFSTSTVDSTTYLRPEITQVGSTTPGAELTVQLICTW